MHPDEISTVVREHVREEIGIRATVGEPMWHKKRHVWTVDIFAAESIGSDESRPDRTVGIAEVTESGEIVSFPSRVELRRKRARVLIAEDVDSTRDLWEAIFSVNSPYAETVFVRNGEEAVRLATEACFDVVVLDVNMPVLDGVQALKQIRKLKPETKAFLMTGTYRGQAVADYADKVGLLPDRLPTGVCYLVARKGSEVTSPGDLIGLVNALLENDYSRLPREMMVQCTEAPVPLIGLGAGVPRLRGRADSTHRSPVGKSGG